MTERRTAWNSTLPAPTKPLSRSAGLKQGTGIAARRTSLRPVSDKRRAENRQRRAMVAALYSERPMCGRPGCARYADDLHEPLTRARGGSIVDPDNQVPLCREDHDIVTFRPESELGWAYEAKILIHSWEVQR